MNSELYGYISNNPPTTEIERFLWERGIVPYYLGNQNAFVLDKTFVERNSVGVEIDGVIVLHPAAALNLAENYKIACIEFTRSYSRNGGSDLIPKELHVWDLRKKGETK